MNQGYREQTTTTQQDYPPQDKQTGKQATRITRSTKKAREANNIYEVTSVPVQHSPRSIRPEVISKRVNPAPSPERPASPHVSNVTSYDSTGKCMRTHFGKVHWERICLSVPDAKVRIASRNTVVPYRPGKLGGGIAQRICSDCSSPLRNL